MKKTAARMPVPAVTAMKIEDVSPLEAANLLMSVKRRGTYQPYIPVVVECLRSMGKDEYKKFHVPKINGLTSEQSARRLMSLVNSELRDRKIGQRVWPVPGTDLLVSEPTLWNLADKN